MQRYSLVYTKTTKQTPSDEQSKNAQLLIKAGFINKEMAGVYAYLLFGHKTLFKIIQIIREEMNRLDANEVLLGSLQNPQTWLASKRWGDDVIDVWFKTKLANNTEIGLANTHEEPMSKIMSNYIKSYKDLPCYLYQFQTKFRNELRAKSGIMRTREFIMKDLYSFSKNQQELNDFYEKVKQAYINIFNKVGIGKKTYLTFASGGAFTKFSHEFQTVSKAGEDIIYIDHKKNIAINKEVYTNEVLKDLGVKKSDLEEKKSIEVGNIFKLGTKYAKALGLNYTDKNGEVKDVVMGSYGIGPGRLMGTIVELFNDEKGIIWPNSVAPYNVHFITLDKKNNKQAEKIINKIEQAGYEVLWDETESTAGKKFANADLIGCPIRILLSEKSIKSGGLECKPRNSQKSEIIKESDIVGYLTKTLKP